MKEFKGCENYTLESTEKLDDIKSTAFRLVHNKTGARIVLIQNDDENKSFIIGFKTPQHESTGVPHILEHSVLCGSEKFPVKDAMTEVNKGSLNTFLNAFTYPDRTLYPVASMNDKDFKNLMHVYLDAVFFPNVHNEKKIFMQEGWHYELDDPDGELTINGVVYNEMKGVYSSPESALSSYVIFSLFPDTQYGVESGGDPEVIPELKYEDFCKFHKKLYHPSNARIFLYGDCDFEERLKFMDREYLSKFDRITPDSEVELQEPFEKPLRVVKEYPISESDSEKEATFLTYNVVSSDYRDVKMTVAMDVINYALCGVPGSILEKRLLDAGIGKNIYIDYETDTCQKVFSIVAQNADPEDEDRFVEVIETAFKDIIRDGFDKKTLEAAITSQEFSYREGDFGYLTKGIATGMMVMDDWNYTDGEIFTNLKQNEVYAELRKGIEEGFFEKTLKTRILENPHKTILVMKPSKGLEKKKNDELRKKLAAYKAGLSKEEIESIIRETAELKNYQEEEDSEEALQTIPTLSLKDIKKEAKKLFFDTYKINDVTTVYTKESTNGIVYFSLDFSMKGLPERLLYPFSMYKLVIGMLDTEHFSYSELANEINIKTGGIGINNSLCRNYEDPSDYSAGLEIKGKMLYGNIKDAFDLVKEIIFTSRLDSKKRIKELLEMALVRVEGYMIQSGHAVAVSRAKSYYEPVAKLSEIMSGIDEYRYIEELVADFDNRIDTLVSEMQEVASFIYTRSGLEVFFTSEEQAKKDFENELSDFIAGLGEGTGEKKDFAIEAEDKGEGFTTSSQVQYVAQCGSFLKAGLPYTGSLQVLKNILSNDYLWTEVRLKGGAYGCMCGFTRFGDGYFASYRDPNVNKTLEAYKGCVDYTKDYPDDAESIERYVISSIGELDTPLTPSLIADKAHMMYKCHISNEVLQKERDEVLKTDGETIRDLSKYLEAILSEGAVCAVGGEEMLNKESEAFKTVVPLVNKQ